MSIILSESRKTFIQYGGGALALPFLPSYAKGEKDSQSIDKKLIIFYTPNGICRRGFFPGEEEAKLPRFMGNFSADRIKKDRLMQKDGVKALPLTPTMMPLKDHKNDITLVTGMDRTFLEGQDVHAQAASCYLTSVSPQQAKAKGWRYPNGRTLDQIVADKIGDSTIFKTLAISCNSFKAGHEANEFDHISWYGLNKPVPSIRDPREFYNRMFYPKKLKKQFKNISDLVLADLKTLSKQVDKKDAHKLEEYATMLRQIELRMERLEGVSEKKQFKIPNKIGYNRDEYIKLQIDLMVLALEAGLTNVCTFMLGPERWNAPMMFEGVFDHPVMHHGMSHTQGSEGYLELMKIDKFYMGQYAYALSKLKTLKMSDGKTILDHSLVTYGAGLGDGATHQYFDLPFILAGGAGGQLKQGQYVQCESGTLNSNMWLSIAKLMGLELQSFADSTGVIKQIWA